MHNAWWKWIGYRGIPIELYGINVYVHVQIFQATDADVGNNSIVYFRILSNNVPYVVDRDSGVVTTAGVFAGMSGTIHNVEVEAFDNFGIPPTNRRTGILIVSFLADFIAIIIIILLCVEYYGLYVNGWILIKYAFSLDCAGEDLQVNRPGHHHL